ncbi:hypothetical protein GGS23DRAFT_257260 [Durotheca rogersii]|uniref:uncharacterized protein n=1 Tax=Durotheca rogersii TaxID=419775 RepID=UPI00221ED59D|nr:uncharacterized protein GGS23DRAFT_257260 [Durotheca rogersii]KAI5859976.1 hypothetical protein GGS23DRAFT_257260 [Durotheca rogersii]
MPSTLVPFLYRTRTILRANPRTVTLFARSFHGTHRRLDGPYNIPFVKEVGEGQDSSEPGSRSTITLAERQVFERIFADIRARGLKPATHDSDHPQPSSPAARSAMLIMQQAAYDAGQSRSATVAPPALLAGAAKDRNKALLRFPPPLRAAAQRALDSITHSTSASPLDENVAYDEESIKAEEDEDWQTPAHTFGRTVELEAKRYPERSRVEGLIMAAKSDLELWDVLVNEVFSIPPRLDLGKTDADIKEEKKRKKKAERAARKKMLAEGPVEKEVVKEEVVKEDFYPEEGTPDPFNLSAEFSTTPRGDAQNPDAASVADTTRDADASGTTATTTSDTTATTASDTTATTASDTTATTTSDTAAAAASDTAAAAASDTAAAAASDTTATAADESEAPQPEIEDEVQNQKISLYVYGPLYPAYLLLGLRRLDTAFRVPSPLAFSVLPRVKDLGLESYVLGVSTPFYNELLQIHWNRRGDLPGVLDLLEEMRRCGIYFDEQTASILNQIDNDISSLGEKGWKNKASFIGALAKTPELDDMMQGRIRHWHRAVDLSIKEKLQDLGV